MFCRLGFEEESRPVAAPAWLKVVCSATRNWVDQERKSVGVGSFEFRELPMFQHFAGDLMLLGKVLQHISGGRDHFSLAHLRGRGQVQIFKQNLTQLLWRVDIEGLTGDLKDLAG